MTDATKTRSRDAALSIDPDTGEVILAKDAKGGAKEAQTAKTKSPFALFSRNFCNYPLARSAAATPRSMPRYSNGWRRHLVLHRHSRTKAPLVILILPFGDEPRAPGRFDVDLLLFLTAQASRARLGFVHTLALEAGRAAIDQAASRREAKTLFYQTHTEGHPQDRFNAALRLRPGEYERALGLVSGDPSRDAERWRGAVAYAEASKQLRRSRKILDDITLEFPSLRALICALGRAPNKPENFASVRASLEYWTRARIRYVGSWHASKGKRSLEFGFIKRLTFEPGGRVLVQLDPTFLASTLSYAAKIKLPLPVGSEGTQNLHVLCRGWRAAALGERQWKLATLCQRLGIVGRWPSELRHALMRAVDAVNRYRRERGQGALLGVVFEGGKVRLHVVRSN